MKSQSKINCPECGSEIKVEEILKHQIEQNLKRDLQKERSKIEEAQKLAQDLLNEERNQFEAKKEKENELFRDRLEKETKKVRKDLEGKLRKGLEEERKEQLESLEKELNEKTEKLKDLHKKEALISKLQRDKEELKSSIEADAQKRLNEQLSMEKAKIKKAAAEANELKLRELQKQLDDQKKLTEEMKRKQEQGSMQIQGEVQELAIEEWLAAQFPLDGIEEIKKGAKGADCLQMVNTRTKTNCGTIYFESKRAKAFQSSWIEKFKNDIRDKNANMGVLVTESLPIGMSRMGLVSGIWVCTYEEFKGLAAVLRESIIQINSVVATQENKGDKMSLLYNYLTSNEFKLRIEGIVEGFSQMKSDLEKEKNAMSRIWNQREKQLDKVILNTTGMYGSLKGIAGGAISDIKLLEL